jgi:hypothetical protein
MSCLQHTNYSLLFHSLDPAHEEPEFEVQAEQANTNPEQGMPQCITPQSLTLIANHYLYVKIHCALGLYELLGTIVALILPS